MLVFQKVLILTLQGGILAWGLDSEVPGAEL